MAEKIQSFTQLRCWQSARELSVKIYQLTAKFPSFERFGLTSQIRRSSVSIAANVAEGFARNTAKDKINFYHMALGSQTETLSHSYIACDLGYLQELDLQDIMIHTTEVSKMINGLIRTAEGRSIRNT